MSALGLAACVLEKYMQRILGFVESQKERSDIPALERLVSIHKYFIDFLKVSDDKCGCLLGGFAAELGATAPEIHAVMKKHKDNWLSHYIDLMGLAQEQGDVRSDLSPETLASLVWTQWQGALLKMEIEQAVDHLEMSFFAMIDVIRVPAVQPKETK